MKKTSGIRFSVTVLILIVFLAGCGVKNDSISQEDYLKIKQELSEANLKIQELEENESANSGKKELRILRQQDNQLMYVYEEDTYSASEIITIIGDNGEELQDSEKVETLDYRGKEGAIIKLKVIGNLYDFKIVELEYNEKTEDLDEVKSICELKEVKDKDIIFSSMLPEGMPSEAIKWKDKDGNEQVYYLSYDGYGFDGTIIFNK